jgi:hypothetical protein
MAIGKIPGEGIFDLFPSGALKSRSGWVYWDLNKYFKRYIFSGLQIRRFLYPGCLAEHPGKRDF